MISTSDAWRTAQLEAVVPETFVEIAYNITEPGLQESATVTSTTAVGYAQPASITDTTNKAYSLYATLEQNIWGLDGTFDILPDAEPYGDNGFVSRDFVSSKDFAAVRLSFSSVRTQPIPGITITWSTKYGEYASRFSITAYNGNTEIFSEEYENSNVTTVCTFTLVDYTSIRIEVMEWCLPSHRARVERVFMGVTTTYTKSDLLSYSHSQSGDLLSAELPKNSVSFSLNNVEGMWNPDNLSGMAKYLAERQQLSVRYGMRLGDDIEWIDAGTVWLSEWETPSNGLEVRFVARDLIEFMADPYKGPRSGTLHAIAMSALTQSNLPVQENGAQRFVLSDNLKEWRVDFTEDDGDYTCAEIVQLCANAACCVMYQNRKGVLIVEPLRGNASGYAIKRFVSFAHPEFKLTKLLKSVSVNDGMGTADNATVGEIQTLSNNLITDTTMANRVAEWVRATLEGRRTLSGEYRADPSLDVFDLIAVESKYGMNNAIFVTSIEYTYAGSFKGRYEGRITEFKPEYWYAGELRAGDFKDG
jgi:hypothetical protein